MFRVSLRSQLMTELKKSMESINTPKQITNQFEDLLASQLSEFERKRAMRIIIDYEDKSDRDALIQEKQEFYDSIEQKNKNK